jgi:hypothetical protein
MDPGSLSARIQFRSDEFTAWVSIHEQRMEMGPGETGFSDLPINGNIKELFTGPTPPDEALESGSVAVLKQFMSAFALRA